MRADDVYLAGVGVHLPPAVPTAHAVARGDYPEADRNAAGYRSVLVAGDLPAPDMAVDAARAALRHAGLPADAFGALIHSTTYHQGPDGWSAPHYVLRETLDRPISAVELRQGCVGMISALELAVHRLTADREHDAVLLTTADNFSVPIVDRWRAAKLFVLGDGGAAAVVSRRGGFARVLSVAAYSNPGMEALHRGGERLFPPGITRGISLNFEERSDYWRAQWAKGVTPPMGHLGECVAGAADRALADAGIDLAKIARVCHVGFARGPLHAIYLDALGIEPERGTWEVTSRTGHVGAADPFIGLEHLWRTGEVGPGDHVLLIANAPGMEAGCAVLEIVEPPETEE
ncbi:ketoacyl-ACP synthase III family protein [Saccharothrix violaceirubra]|uniref:3-oxoacyl-[acyl-carrier-protein] synthase-3 n=1 Tax=Saccharothrix violaceirubra TaxID=413306 RepID=A0A7W7T6A3_9PSEU|nr:ketoacyl-ACP synthase III family protein [Saccharothrix violaceirubra]MBB4967363.1 3-oxoacyl-[acyl-carrier-protein] synthase-3 [Saccharothrix violaceirubra]